jgi:uncharacterized oxidoreductase
MKMTGNTILITGGASGIGRGLAEAFHSKGNQVIISGRRQSVLDQVTSRHSGMASVSLDITDKASIQAFAAEALLRFPSINMLINIAGIMKIEDVKGSPSEIEVAEAEIVTNLLGTIRVSAAILPHLLQQQESTLITVSSGLAFVPMTAVPTYCATKAAIHSYSMSLREQLRQTSVSVVEVIPPYVQTELLRPEQANDPNAMPLADFIAETMTLLEKGDTEVVVNACKPLRFAAENGNLAEVMMMLNAQH